MKEKWITESALCRRWKIGKYDLRDMVLHRKLQPFHKDYSGLIIYDGGTAIEHPDGSFTTSPEPATADQVTGCIYLISEVEEYEKKNGITPRTLPTDQPKQGTTDNPLVEPAQEKASNNKPISKPKASIVFDEARKLRRDYPKMNKVEAKKKIDEIIKSHKYLPDCTPYSRTQFNRIIKLLGFPPAPRGAKPTNKKK